VRVNKKKYRSIWTAKVEDKIAIKIIDQRSLPFEFIVEELLTTDDIIVAIKDMHLRGAPLIGIAGAYGVYLSSVEALDITNSVSKMLEIIRSRCEQIINSRPTAVNLSWAVNQVFNKIKVLKTVDEIVEKTLEIANMMADEDVAINKEIGSHGFEVIKKIYNDKKNKLPDSEKGNCKLNILTHCNAGWLATVDYGTALSPVYFANEFSIPLHIWVDETRPRNQGASLTTWELLNEGISHTLIADNTGGHLMQHDMVDLVIVGSDRTTSTGDVANKIGTYLKALAAFDNNIPFYVALPTSTIDFDMKDGVKNIPIEKRDEDEVKYIEGYDNIEKQVKRVLITNEQSNAINYGFDVTPARLVTGLITEKGIVSARYDDIIKLKPEIIN